MKYLYITIVFFCLAAIGQAQDLSCRYGFSYEISNDPHWGRNKPVITGVFPNSPAERAGIKPYDIIEAVDGVPVSEKVLDDIYLFLNPKGKDMVEFTIKNFSYNNKKIKVKKECSSSSSISEEQLATAFAMYAVEYTYDRFFTCPFITTQTKDPVDFSVFKSFDFTDSGHGQPDLAKKINAYIKKELTSRGLKHDRVNPDLMVQIFYSFNKNPNFKPSHVQNDENEKNAPGTYRYDIKKKRMSKFPFLPTNTIETDAEYILKFGFRLEDRKLINGRIIWECEANELMNDSYPLENFVAVHIPLMSMQFPYMKYGRNARFRISKKKYNYTGINYSIENLSEVASVDPNSPAAKAGIRPFDKITQIEGKRMDRTSEQFTLAYRKFLVNTLNLRNENTRFVDANGFPDCMHWSESKYPLVTKAFDHKKNLTAFAYLYHFAPFINPSGNKTCSFKLKRDKEKLEFILSPVIRSESTIAVE